MSKVSYAAGIDTVSGALTKPKNVDGHSHGSYLIGTHRTAATTNPDCLRLYIRKPDVYKRSTAPSADELWLRARFSAVSRAVQARKEDVTRIDADQAAFIAQRDTAGGKKTMTAYLWSLECATYDNAHPRS